MPENEERVGFEAYFETDEFVRDVSRFLNAIDEIRDSVTDLKSFFQEFDATLGRYGQNLNRMSDEVASAFGVVAPIIEGEMAQAGKRGGAMAGDQFTNAMLTTIASRGGQFKQTLGNVLGAILGNMISPGVGGIAGAQIGGAVANITPLINVLGPLGIVLNSAFKTVKFLLGGIGKMIQPIINLFLKLGQTIFKVVGGIAVGAFKALMGVITGLIGIVTGGLVGAFLLLRNTVQQALSGLINKFREWLESAMEFQAIEIATQALVRSALVAEGTVERASDAMQMAVPIADSLLEALQKIALNSPFTMEYVYTIFRTNAAYGLALDTAMELTQAIIEVGAATGFSASVLERIARNFAQVAKNGKIWQRDIYELANAGLDLHRILNEELNMTVEEFNENVQKGEVSVNDLIDALISFTTKNFEGSAEQLSMAMEGLRNRFQTIGTVIVKEFVTPIVSAALPAIDNFLKALVKVTDTGIFETFGKFVRDVLQMIVGDVDFSIESVAKNIMGFFDWLVDTGSKMAQWGYDMMMEWGRGIIEGAIQVISTVANFISKALSALFAPGSPPAILPKIDIWGAKTIEEWLRGMTEADFGIINDIINPVRQALKNLGYEDLGIQGLLQNIVKSLSGALVGGSLAGVTSIISQYLGPYADAINKLISLQLRLRDAIKKVNKEEKEYEKAVEAVEEAQKRLQDAMEFYDETDTRIQKLVREYNALLRAGASDDVLESKLAEINAAHRQRDAAADLIEQREEEIDLAEERREKEEEDLERARDFKDAIQEQVNAQQELVNLMLELTSSIDEAGGAMSELSESLAEGLIQGLGGWEMPAFEGGALETALELMKARIEIKLNRLRMDIEGWIEDLEVMFGDIDWGKLVESFAGLVSTIDTIIKDDPEWETVKTNIKTKLLEIWQNITSDEGFLDGIKSIGRSVADGIVEGIREYISENKWDIVVGAFVIGLLLSFIKAFQIFSPSQVMKTAIGIPIAEGIIVGIESKIEDIGLTAQAVWDKISEVFSTAWEDAYAWGEDTIEGLKAGITDLLESLQEKAAEIWDTIVLGLGNLYDKAFTMGASIIQGIKDGVNSLLGQSLLDWAANVKEKIVGALGWVLDINTPSLVMKKEIGMPIGEGVLSGFTEVISGFGSTMQRALNYMPTPTSAYNPASVRNNSVVNNINMGNNVVRDDTDIALIIAANERALRNASYGV